MMASAQQTPEKLPIDAEVRYGKLDNGLTYYIRHNEQPKQRCEFHIAQCVGAILEEDNQNGLAHFLEHMAFNGTQHFPGKGIINYFESIGVNFGGKGFLAGLEDDELDILLEIADGKYTISRRMMLDVELVRGGSVIFSQ